MRCPGALLLGLALLGGLTGCRGNNRCDQVETELRAREDDVRHLRDELDRTEFQNQILCRELAAVRGVPGPLGVVEKPSQPYPIRSIRLGRQTAGRASESCSGDDALQVQVEPLDCENQALKAPGNLSIEVLEVSKEGLKRHLSSWDFPAPELRRKWQSGLFTTGYVMTLPWKVAPSTEKLRVLARFQLVDGRLFEADKDITVRLLPEHARRLILPHPDPVTPAIPDTLGAASTPPHTMPPAPSPPIDPPPPSPPTPSTSLPSPTEVVPRGPTEVPAPPKAPDKTPKKPTASPADGPRLLQRPPPPVPSRVELLRPIPFPPDP